MSGPVGRLAASRWSRARQSASSSAGTPSTHSDGGTGSCELFMRRGHRPPIRRTVPSRRVPRRERRRRCTSPRPGSAPRPSLARAPCTGRCPRSRRPPTRLSSALRERSVATPKSRITTRPSWVTRTFDGLMSRCSFPAPCSAWTPSTSCRSARRSRSRSAGEVFGNGSGAVARAPASSRMGAVIRVGPRVRDAQDARGRLDIATRPRLLNEGEEVGPVDELHREEDVVSLRDDELVEAHEVRVMNVGERPKLLLEPKEGRRGEAEQTLQGDDLTPLAIERFVDDAHAAFADPTYDVEALVAAPLGHAPRLGRRVGRQCSAVFRCVARWLRTIAAHVCIIEVASMKRGTTTLATLAFVARRGKSALVCALADERHAGERGSGGAGASTRIGITASAPQA